VQHSPGRLEWWADTGDASRLVHADSLTARGDPLGEFILLQCTQPQSPRLAELWTAHHVAWLAALGFPSLGWFVKGPGLSSAMHRVGYQRADPAARAPRATVAIAPRAAGARSFLNHAFLRARKI